MRTLLACATQTIRGVRLPCFGQCRLCLIPGELVYYFSHHEKLCVVDNMAAAMGGLDACYGRWDTHNHPLADVHPTEFYKSLFPGQGLVALSRTMIMS
jgi:hypothetical protein